MCQRGNFRICCCLFFAALTSLCFSPVIAQTSVPNQSDFVGRAGKSLVFGGPGGGHGETLKGFFAKFTKETGINVVYLTGPVQDLYGRLRAEQGQPSIDLYYSSPVTEVKGIEDGLYEALDPHIVTNLPRLYPMARVANDMGVRFEMTPVGILFNRKIYNDNKIPAPTKWSDIWDPAVRGHVIIGDTSSFYTVTYIAFINRTLGGSESDPSRGIGYIADHKSNLLAIVRTYPQRVQFLASGEAWLTVDGGFTSLPEVRKNPDLDFLVPSDGAPLFWQSLHVIKGASNPIGAQLLLNYMISVEVQTENAKLSFAGPVNMDVKLSEEVAKTVPYGPDAIKQLVVLDNAAIASSLEKYRDEWDEKMK